MAEKSKFRLYLLSFSLAVFILTALASVIAYLGWFHNRFPFLLIFIYVAAFALLLAFASDLLIDKYKLSRKKVLLLTLSVITLAAILMQSVWTIITPSWSFSVTTDKPSYKLGEDVKISVTLKNTGFIAHSFKSKISDPVMVLIYTDFGISLWYSPYHQSITNFSLMPNQSLERNFTWNQTNIVNPSFWNQRGIPGTYYIQAFIPDAGASVISPSSGDVLFIAYARINITSP